ncbi:hypothetical protein GA0111570_10424 [Raineyella antarctica]|uniref:Uncharacterized protein n=1 Tax=Raineyella antarctica TaxID=1577474 RepID=A0A1G6GKT2_9ACTN|nr:DUF5652 family protein [Raineyella antarctica]SDB82618.1 hypothetical protein GA0111570_10424 [Raineyella antarctica]
MRGSKKHWRDLSPATRRAITVGAVVDLGLRTWAIVDLVKRPQKQVQGNKSLWAAALSVINSVGIVPIIYLVWGRKD